MVGTEPGRTGAAPYPSCTRRMHALVRPSTTLATSVDNLSFDRTLLLASLSCVSSALAIVFGDNASTVPYSPSNALHPDLQLAVTNT